MISELVMGGLSEKELDIIGCFNPNNEYLSRALGWALVAHRDQKRRSGELYIEHPIEVAKILTKWGLSQNDIQAAALLHDTVEDSDTSLEDIDIRWGNKVASWVDGVSKFGSDLETLKRVTSRTFVDAGTGLIKLADRLHNMRTLDAMPPSKQLKISEETNMVYKELADSLGMWSAKEELSDLAFKYLDPEMYKKIGDQIFEDPRTDPTCYLHFKSKFESLFYMSGLKCEIGVRFKGKYSTYIKREKNIFSGECSPKDLIGIDDLVSIGIVVDTREDCYKALEKIHNDRDGKVVVDRIKDRIANPADNNFMALQTIIMSSDGPIEIAIMTVKMKAYNDFGIAHTMSIDPAAKYTLLKPIFLPSGRALFMPPQSTGVDLMCRQNPSLARHKPELLIDGKQSPMTTVIPVGSTAEVVPSSDESHMIDEHLLKYCLPDGERKLRTIQLISQEEDLRDKGRIILEEILIPRGILKLEDLGANLVNKIVRGFDRLNNRVKSLDQLYHLVGGGFLNSEWVSSVLDKSSITKSSLGLSTVLVKGDDDKPGILNFLIGTITETGGNIKDVHTETDRGFEVRIVASGLSREAELLLLDKLRSNHVFNNVIVI